MWQTKAAVRARTDAVSEVFKRRGRTVVSAVEPLATGKYSVCVPFESEACNREIRLLGVDVSDVRDEDGANRVDLRRVEFVPDAPQWRLLGLTATVRRVALATLTLCLCVHVGLSLR